MAPLRAPTIAIPGLPPLEWESVSGRAHIDNGVLTLLAFAGADWLRSPTDDDGVVHTACALGFGVDRELTLSARVSVAGTSGARAPYDAPVLAVWRHGDPEHYAKLALERARDGSDGVVSVVTNGVSDDASAFTVRADHVWLRITVMPRPGPAPAQGPEAPSTSFACAFHASTDGVRWRFVRVFRLGGAGEVRVGFLSQSPTGSGCAAQFRDIRLSHSVPASLRDGS